MEQGDFPPGLYKPTAQNITQALSLKEAIKIGEIPPPHHPACLAQHGEKGPDICRRPDNCSLKDLPLQACRLFLQKGYCDRLASQKGCLAALHASVAADKNGTLFLLPARQGVTALPSCNRTEADRRKDAKQRKKQAAKGNAAEGEKIAMRQAGLKYVQGLQALRMETEEELFRGPPPGSKAMDLLAEGDAMNKMAKNVRATLERVDLPRNMLRRGLKRSREQEKEQ